ncbi:MAG TPA: alpha/beta hydrolase [Acidimicrobiia bacterium]|jgi:pimeloyl-ACP methyl ester carboxylesterase
MPTAFVNGIDIYFERDGSGRPLLFLNGSGSTLEGSKMLIDPFRARADVVAHDQRGLGRTSVPAGPYTMADYAADAAALLDHVGWPTCAVVGVSFGGMVAQELAVTWPERIERLALVCTSPGGPDAASYPLHTLAELDEADRGAVAIRLLDTRFTPEWLATHDSDRMLAQFMAQRSTPAPDSDAASRATASRVPTERARGAREGPPQPAALGERSEQEARDGAREQLLARSGHDVCDRLGRITCPTFVAAGRYDGIAPLGNAEAIAARVPGSTLHVYEGGHAFFAQDPAAIPDVIDFLTTP